MSSLDQLITFSGNWQGKNLLWLSPNNPAQESAATLSLAPTINAKFIEVKYTWAYDGKLQEGVLIIGYETERQLATAFWADSWHMGEKVMHCQGVVKGKGSIDVRGLYQAPIGPDWGWRIVIEPENEATLDLIMYNITPDGEEALAVKAVYSRISK